MKYCLLLSDPCFFRAGVSIYQSCLCNFIFPPIFACGFRDWHVARYLGEKSCEVACFSLSKKFSLSLYPQQRIYVSCPSSNKQLQECIKSSQVGSFRTRIYGGDIEGLVLCTWPCWPKLVGSAWSAIEKLSIKAFIPAGHQKLPFCERKLLWTQKSIHITDRPCPNMLWKKDSYKLFLFE